MEVLASRYDPAPVSSGTWFDPTGATPYDRVLIRLHSAEPYTQATRVKALLVGSKCGKASAVSFRKPSVDGFHMGGLLAYRRTDDAPKCVEWAVGPATAVVANPDDPNVRTLDAGEGGWTARCPVPAAAGVWQEHTLTRTGDGGATLVVSVKLEKWESPVDSKEALDKIALQEITFTMPAENGRAELLGASGLKATMAFKTRPANRKMIFWLPGRNDYVMHAYAITAFLDAGFDVFALEHRRLGRSNRACSVDEMNLISHCEGNLRVLMQDFDTGLQHALGLKPYDKTVLYAHSTGGLEAAMWLRERGAKLPFSAVVLNSPFLAWGNEGSADFILDATDGPLGLYRLLTCLPNVDTCVSNTLDTAPSSQPGAYGTGIWMQYPNVDCTLRQIVGIGHKVTLGWVHACTKEHSALVEQGPSTTVPTYLLTTPGDCVLETAELKERAKYVSPAAEVESVPYCRHDMLLNYDKEQNDLVVAKILGWLAKTLA